MPNNEDFFWGKVAKKNFSWFKVPLEKEALKFSFEANPQFLFKLNQSIKFKRVITDLCLLDNDNYLKNRTSAFKLANEFLEKCDFEKQYSDLFNKGINQ